MHTLSLQTKFALQSASATLPHMRSSLNPESECNLPKPQLPCKRKQEDATRSASFSKRFTIFSCPQNSLDGPEAFTPIRLIDRAQLPLTFLDTSPCNDFPQNRLFHTSIELWEDNGGALPRLLIAKHERSKSLCAIERVQRGVFSLHKLASWVNEKEVESLWNPSKCNTYASLLSRQHSGVEWWANSAVELPDVGVNETCLRTSMLRPRSNGQEPGLRDGLEHSGVHSSNGKSTTACVQTVSHGKEQTASSLEAADSGIVQEPMAGDEGPTPQQLLEGLVHQYLDAVYLSKTSLAYFAKGPIARVRTAFVSADETAPPTHELVTFLRSMLLSHKASEKKYQTKLPEVIRSIPPSAYSDDDVTNGPRKSKKGPKKIKLSRDGMYPQESDIVKKWWVSEALSQETHSEETLDQRIKRRIGDLRVREALAQMILILEITALESLSTYKAPADTDSAINTGVATQAETQTTTSNKRKKKSEDISLLLDLLLDKLCIWQSVDQDGILDFDKKGDGAEKVGQAGAGDRLQNFCVEVIVPFYMSRLPEQARMINKKLRGPVHMSPPKRKAANSGPASRKSKEPKETDSKRPRRSLGRVATDTVALTNPTRRGTTPSLNRSTTDPVLTALIKREPSEVPLGDIPFQRSPSKAARSSVFHLKHLKGRQIDLSAPSAAAEAKLKQRKRVEEDLQDAILALKKPNRGLAAGSYVDDIERRGVGAPNRSRKPAITSRKVLKGVQVSATPRVGRKMKQVVESTPIRRRGHVDVPDAPAASDFCIPSSAVRSVVPGTVHRGVVERTAGVAAISETPTKAPSRKQLAPPNTHGGAIFATPAKRRLIPESLPGNRSSPGTIFATPLPPKPRRGIEDNPNKQDVFGDSAKVNLSLPEVPVALAAALTTPTKTRPVVYGSGAANTPQPVQENAEVSIYDALGWNDDDDDVF
ncbi:hypothetical protein M011DRAFT_468557 [Sporormia fimetaria CBS 119925]|uniref:DNA replication regulator Sld3 C-terminal domain-containing protein n=1 Tax=Sporormia fimetaria CBS 119925 TaxID=1340428 RepID=A0A6A6V782_9PLEO|nr:hypothetical protein M011DRAFT_468557 [Sporormia fimetaria CBS 119925]